MQPSQFQGAADVLDGRAKPKPENEDDAVATETVDFVQCVSRTALPSPSTAPAPSTADPGTQAVPDLPVHSNRTVGRYRVIKELGRGGYGAVYLAEDEHLNRRVAIKEAHPAKIRGPKDIEAYLSEARKLAALDHSGIVPVFDVGRTEDDRWYVVSKFVAGGNLADLIKGRRLSFSESARIVAEVAEALHYAHRQGLVHRDVKPANILIDASGKPCLADFGLAISEQELGSGPGCIGTIPYMSPEQARGSGNRVDGRSDIFSLGVVLYELLTNRRPFRGNTEFELLDQIVSTEPKPPRQIDDAIPAELERICLKALRKPLAERYTTAKDMAEELAAFLTSNSGAAAPYPSVFPAEAAVDTRLVAADPTQSGSGAANKGIFTARFSFLRVAVLTAVTSCLLIAASVGVVLSLKASASGAFTDVSSASKIPGRPAEALTKPASDAGKVGDLIGVGANPRISLVASLQASLFRGETAKPLGELGSALDSTAVGDDVRVQATFIEPVHVFLLALNPDGQLQLCYPADEQTAPAQTTSLTFPPATTDYFGLTDGAGRQAFAVLVSREPLPAFAEWRSKLAKLVWKPDDSPGVWRFDDGTYTPMPAERGQVRQRTPQPFVEACEFLKSVDGIDCVAAITFPVRPASP